MEGPDQEKIIEILQQNFGEEILQVEMLYDFLTVSLKKEKIVEIVQFLYNDPRAQLQYLTTLCGIHYPEQNQIAVQYQLHNLISNQRIRLKVYLPEENPVIASITPVFVGANWMERETYDFYGVVFEGHPSLKRILNVDDMIIFPMRKEYPLEDQTRGDKLDPMFGR